MSTSSESFPNHLVTCDTLSPQERVSREFEDCVAGMLRRLGFEVRQRALVPIAPGVYHEVDQLCFSVELSGSDEDRVGSSTTQRRVLWVETKLKLNGGQVGREVLLHLWGAFACMLHHGREDDLFPDAIWVVTNGKFSGAARRFVRVLNDGFGRELFVLVDGRKLEQLMSEERFERNPNRT